MLGSIRTNLFLSCEPACDSCYLCVTVCRIHLEFHQSSVILCLSMASDEILSLLKQYPTLMLTPDGQRVCTQRSSTSLCDAQWTNIFIIPSV